MGRERELSSLSRLLDAACRGRPGFVICGGEPGIGKTRLALELTDRALARSLPTVWGRAPEGVAAAPFWLWRQVMPTDAAPMGPPRDSAEDPAAARLALFDAVREHLGEQARQQGLLIVLDDVQRADEPSMLLLRHIVREMRDERLLILATERTVASEATPGWQAVRTDLIQVPVTEHLQLRHLSVDDTIRCAAAVMGTTIDRRTGRELHAATKGNPFFVTELARARATGASAVPGTVLDVITRRVGTLQPAAQRLLAAAAVLGEQFSLPVAASLIDRPVAGCLPLLEDASGAGLVEPTSVAGDWRFSHALSRDAIEQQIPLAERIELHRAAAEAIERTYAGQLDTRLADLARHWAAVAVTGERANAVRWADLAAEEAMRLLAYEEAARLFRLALDCGGPELDVDARGRLLLDLEHAEWRSGHLEAALATCRATVELARQADRPHLLAEAALTIEPVGALTWDLDLALWCREALTVLDEGDGTIRGRLLARLSEASVYTGDDEAAVATSASALALADQADDVVAVVAALRARQLAMSGPEHLGERSVLADRMIEIGIGLRRPSIEMWGRLWRIDAHWERGELSAIASEITRLDWCVGHVGGPMANWHLLTARAGLAQATASFEEARARGMEAFTSMQWIRHPTAFGAYASLMGALGHHIGHEHVWGDMLPVVTSGGPVDSGEVRGAIFSHVGTALVLLESERPDEALTAFRGAGPVHRWRPPPYFRVLSWAVGSMVAIGLGLRDDVEFFLGRMAHDRNRHTVAGAGNASYFGPVELHLGRAAAFLGRGDDAETDLRAAAEKCRMIGARGFAVEADCELAHVVAERDIGEARSLATLARGQAARLGMGPWERRAATLLARIGTAQALSKRELEVAGLVAEGRTNRAIAEELFMSERTAQTHVQHILTKLGLSNRTQIAAWLSGQRQSKYGDT